MSLLGAHGYSRGSGIFFFRSSFNFVLSCCGISLSPSHFLIPGWHFVDLPQSETLMGPPA